MRHNRLMSASVGGGRGLMSTDWVTTSSVAPVFPTCLMFGSRRTNAEVGSPGSGNVAEKRVRITEYAHSPPRPWHAFFALKLRAVRAELEKDFLEACHEHPSELVVLCLGLAWAILFAVELVGNLVVFFGRMLRRKNGVRRMEGDGLKTIWKVALGRWSSSSVLGGVVGVVGGVCVLSVAIICPGGGFSLDYQEFLHVKQFRKLFCFVCASTIVVVVQLVLQVAKKSARSVGDSASDVLSCSGTRRKSDLQEFVALLLALLT